MPYKMDSFIDICECKSGTLTLKFFPSIKEALYDTPLEEMYVVTDAQVIFGLDSCQICQLKKIFVRYRLRDITQMISNIQSEFKLKLSFKYVPTAKNSADG